MNNTALILIDLINEIAHPDGKFAGKRYPDFIRKNKTLDHANQAVAKARETGMPIFWVRVSFSPDYDELPLSSPLFGKAKEFGALKGDSWATEFHEELDVRENDVKIVKSRVSAFYGTALQMHLRARGINKVLIGGVATDLAVESAARDAHDRDFEVVVLADCCAAGSDEDHERSLLNMAKICRVSNLGETLGES